MAEWGADVGSAANRDPSQQKAMIRRHAIYMVAHRDTRLGTRFLNVCWIEGVFGGQVLMEAVEDRGEKEEEEEEE